MHRQSVRQMGKRWLMVIALVVSAVLQIAARTWKPEEVPIPYLQDARRYVSNPENILSTTAVDSLDRMLFALERDKGVQTVVMVLDKLEGDDPYEFAMAVARKYGVGNKEKRTGLVVVLATGDRSYYFLTGNGLEAIITDGLIQQIEDRIFIPELKKENWDGAMVKAMSAIDQVCRGDDSLVRGKSSTDDGDAGWILLFILLVGSVFIVSIIYTSEKAKKAPKVCPKCGQKEYRWKSEYTSRSYRKGHRTRVVQTFYHCSACGYEDSKREEHDDDFNASGAMLAGSILGEMARGRHRSGGWGSGLGGGGFGGGSFGGGSFGGGGGGGRF